MRRDDHLNTPFLPIHTHTHCNRRQCIPNPNLIVLYLQIPFVNDHIKSIVRKCFKNSNYNIRITHKKRYLSQTPRHCNSISPLEMVTVIHLFVHTFSIRSISSAWTPFRPVKISRSMFDRSLCFWERYARNDVNLWRNFTYEEWRWLLISREDVHFITSYIHCKDGQVLIPTRWSWGNHGP